MDANNQKAIEMAAQICKEHGDFIYSVIMVHIGNVSDADDLFQDFFVSLVTSPVPAYIDNLMPYLYRMLMNDIYDEIRKNKCRKIRILKYGRLRDRYPCDDPLEIAGNHDEVAKMFDLIDEKLPKHEAYALIHSHYHDKTVDELAEEMCIKKRTVSRYICTGRKKLKAHLENCVALQEEHRRF